MGRAWEGKKRSGQIVYENSDTSENDRARIAVTIILEETVGAAGMPTLFRGWELKRQTD